MAVREAKRRASKILVLTANKTMYNVSNSKGSADAFLYQVM